MCKRLLPLIPAGLVVEDVRVSPVGLTIGAHPRSASAACPRCGCLSHRVHSRYLRVLADLPWQGRVVSIEVQARRFRCLTPGCPCRIFAEPLSGIAGRHQRRTCRLGDIQRQVGLALGGDPGARLTARLGMTTSGDTLLRLVRRRDDHADADGGLRVIGVDDWAWRRGHRYGTILVDLEKRRIVDLLPDRDADTFATWLREHPDVEIIARDRGSSYAEGGRRGAPEAIHVADRWHLLENCSAAVLEAVKRHQPTLRSAARSLAEEAQPSPAPSAPDPSTMTSAQRRQWEGWCRRMQRHAEVVRLHRSGVPAHQIARDLALSRNTVRRWIRGGQLELYRPRMHSLDPWRAYLEHRWAAGCRNGARLWRDVRKEGFKGGLRVVTEWASRQRLATAPAKIAIPSARRAARLLVADLGVLDAAERKHIERLLATSPALARVRDLARRFSAMIRTHDAEAFHTWLADAVDSELASFTCGLRQDEAAVRAALDQPWSSGQVEGQITRLKLVKRQGYGRAKLDLLRARLLAE